MLFTIYTTKRYILFFVYYAIGCESNLYNEKERNSLSILHLVLGILPRWSSLQGKKRYNGLVYTVDEIHWDMAI